ncbi:MAG: hypothetical protein U9Q12_01890, partial [Patescibacteria group bacterium]|nr:hypothetical protein [Patescibacteria group bacterium]
CEEKEELPIVPVCSECGKKFDQVPYPKVKVVRVVETTDTTNTPFGEEPEILDGPLFDAIARDVQEIVAYRTQFPDYMPCAECTEKEDSVLKQSRQEAATAYEPRNQ